MKRKSNKSVNIEAIKNNIYAFKIALAISKKTVFHILIKNLLAQLEWIFFSAVFIRYIINSIVNKKSFEHIFMFIIISGIVFAAVHLYQSYVTNYMYTLNSTKIYGGLYEKLYAKARNVELSCFENPEFYNKYTMAIDGAGEKIMKVIEDISQIVSGLIGTILVFYTMYDIDHTVVLFVIFPLLGNFLFGGIMNKYELQRYQENIPNERDIQYVNRVMYLADYAKEIRLSNIYNLLMKKYDIAVKRIVANAEKFAPKIIPPNICKNIFTYNLIFEGILLYGAYKAIVLQKINLAQMAVLSSIMVSATWILIGLFNTTVDCMKNGLFVDNLRKFMEYKEKIPEDYDGITMESYVSTIEFKNVYFSYDGEGNTINDLSFKIYENEVIALVGCNGAGKSTIIKLLLRLYDPTSGEILVNGRNIKEYNLKAYRKAFATAFQDYKVLALSIKENILMERKIPDEDEAVIEALKKVELYDKVKKLPNGINTILTKEFDENGAVFSGGQYQKIAVARTFVHDCPVKIYDEPSSALDPISEFNLYDSMMKENNNKTMIFITHRLSSVKNADKIFMLENGTLIEEGNHDELMKLNCKYAEMYTKQAMNYMAVDNIEGVSL